MKIERKISKRYSVEIEKNDNFGCAAGTPHTMYIINLYDLENYHDPGNRMWYIQSTEELRKLRDTIDSFLGMMENP